MKKSRIAIIALFATLWCDGMAQKVYELSAPKSPILIVDGKLDMVFTSRMSVHFNDSTSTPQVQEYFLRINYVGDIAFAFIYGQLCQDQFWQGEP